jgi:hypothetical protein
MKGDVSTADLSTKVRVEKGINNNEFNEIKLNAKIRRSLPTKKLPNV